MIKVEMCRWYEWSTRPICKKGRKAGVKCHSKRPSCPYYEESESRFDEGDKDVSMPQDG